MSKGAAGDASTRLIATAIGSIGVVFGDIGTSPLYTLQVAAEAQRGGVLAREAVLGVVSLILWALILAVSVKYVTFVMRADNRGEGGILALLALLRPTETAVPSVMALLVIAGAALLFGDGLITPAISVLSALEGLQMAAPGFEPYIVPLTSVVLFVLFAVQSRGTGGLGALFGPVMVVWFTTIGVLGLREILRNDEILTAVSPVWGARYFARHGLHGLGILGVVVLAITGGEALYADMGHFGPRPIRLSWFSLVLPALALSYLGQGALILRDPRALANPFFAMVPPGLATYALVALAAMATTIASQALISGVFSLTHQAVQLGYFPRVTIRHTSREAEGQIYVPLMNWALMVGSVALVLGFRHSARLGAAYGIAVSGTMAITSVVFFEVTRKTWGWPAVRSVPLLLLFLSFDLPFFGANLTKFVDGGYIPILVGALFFVMMLDWHVGRQNLRELMESRSMPLEKFGDLLTSRNVARVPGTGIYLSTTHGIPHTLAMQADRLRSMMERIVLLTVVVEHEPQLDDARRYEVESLAHGFVRVIVHFGYMENPRVPRALARALEASGVAVPLDNATYYVGRETVVAGKGGRMGPVAERLFAFLGRNATSAIAHFGLPLDQVVELGTWVDL
jgi:KUP system potassium uptake protein